MSSSAQGCGASLVQPIDPQSFQVERVMGIEPTLVAWEATVLPLNYTRAPGERENSRARTASQPQACNTRNH